MTHISDVVDVTKAIQKVTFVFGQPIDMLGEDDLFKSLRVVQAEIDSLTEQNKAIGSTAIAKRVALLESQKAELLAVLDANVAAEAAPSTNTDE